VYQVIPGKSAWAAI